MKIIESNNDTGVFAGEPKKEEHFINLPRMTDLQAHRIASTLNAHLSGAKIYRCVPDDYRLQP